MRLAATNPMGRVMLSILVFEAVVFGLAIAGMIQVSDVPVSVAFAAGLGAAGFALVAAALLRTPAGYPLGWLTQVVAIGFGFLTDMMFWLGGAFALLWVVCFALGRRIAATPPAGRETAAPER